MLTSLRVPPRPVALGRVLLAGAALLTCYEGAGILSALQRDRVRTPVADVLPSVTALPLAAWFFTMLAACVLLATGVLAPWSAATIAAGNVVLLAADQQFYSNHRYLLVLLCLLFALSRTDHALAVGARRRRARGDGLVPWWPQLLVVAAVSSCYLFAGLSKLNPEFLSGDLLQAMSPSWVPARLTAWLTAPAEVAIGIGIWSPAARRAALVLGVLLHLSILVLLGSPVAFGAFALLCFSAYPLVWAWPRTRQAEAAATQRSSVA